MQVNVRPNAASTLNCALCPLLAVSCGDAGLALFTMTLSSLRMDYSRILYYVETAVPTDNTQAYSNLEVTHFPNASTAILHISHCSFITYTNLLLQSYHYRYHTDVGKCIFLYAVNYTL
jgi:hypothetical protein